MAGPIRQQFDISSLSDYISSNVPAIALPIEVKQFGYGQSNPTYLLTAKDGEKYVMRKKPPGKLLSKTAHRVDREYRILHALEKTDVAVPKTYCFCADEKVIGTPFYIMKFLAGRIFEEAVIPDVSEADRSEMWHDAIRTLAKFHRLDPASVNMSSYGKPRGFYDRQVALFRTLCDAQAAAKDVETGKLNGHIPHHKELMDFFADKSTQPLDRGTFLHGDYKIDNMVFDPSAPRVIGLLDWEMSTIGHPLVDVCNLLFPHTSANNPMAQKLLNGSRGVGASHKAFLEEGAKTVTPGLPTRAQCLAWYAEVAGFEFTPAEVAWGHAFTAWKLAIIMQGIGARYAVRQATSEKAKEHGTVMVPMGEVAWDLVRVAKQEAEKEKRKGSGGSKL